MLTLNQISVKAGQLKPPVTSTEHPFSNSTTKYYKYSFFGNCSKVIFNGNAINGTAGKDATPLFRRALEIENSVMYSSYVGEGVELMENLTRCVIPNSIAFDHFPVKTKVI